MGIIYDTMILYYNIVLGNSKISIMKTDLSPRYMTVIIIIMRII